MTPIRSLIVGTCPVCRTEHTLNGFGQMYPHTRRRGRWPFRRRVSCSGSGLLPLMSAARIDAESAALQRLLGE